MKIHDEDDDVDLIRHNIFVQGTIQHSHDRERLKPIILGERILDLFYYVITRRST